MNDKKVNIIKAVFCFIVSIACIIIMVMGVPGRGTYYPVVGAVLAAFVGVGFLKRAFDKY